MSRGDYVSLTINQQGNIHIEPCNVEMTSSVTLYATEMTCKFGTAYRELIKHAT